MRPEEDIEKFVRAGKPHETTSKQMDNRTLHDSFTAMEQKIQAKSTNYKPSVFRNIRIRLVAAAAATIIVVIGFFLGRVGNKPEIPTTGHREAIQSEMKLISMMSLRMTYQQGGFDALDQQFRDTLDVLGPRSSSISMQDLLEGINGS